MTANHNRNIKAVASGQQRTQSCELCECTEKNICVIAIEFLLNLLELYFKMNKNSWKIKTRCLLIIEVSIIILKFLLLGTIDYDLLFSVCTQWVCWTTLRIRNLFLWTIDVCTAPVFSISVKATDQTDRCLPAGIQFSVLSPQSSVVGPLWSFVMLLLSPEHDISH